MARLLSIAVIQLALMFGTHSSIAFEPTPPIPGLQFQANRAFVGDPLRGMEAGEAGNLYEFFADTPNHMASTTKGFTLLLAVEAVESGYVDLNDLVVISAKAAGINDNHSGAGQGTHSNQGLVEGIAIRFEDLLYSMMHSSAGDASIAIAQHVAVSIDSTLEDESAALQEAAFTEMMNARAEELGLDDTIFFNAYGGDHVHFNDNTPGVDTSHSASTRDMATWWAIGMEEPLFREIVGLSGTWTFGSWNSAHSFSTSGGGSYPGWTGDKGGSGGACDRCRITSADRIGRELIQAYTTGQSEDEAVLLDYGFASLFHPAKQGESAAWTNGWIDEDLTCMTHDVAASAVVDGNANTRVVVWDVDVDAGTIADANPIVVNHDTAGDLAPAPRNSGDGERTPASKTSLSAKTIDTDRDRAAGDYTGYGESKPVDVPELDEATPFIEPIASAARIEYVGLGNLAVIEETDQGVYLNLYGVNDDHSPFLHDWEFLGQGTEARVTRVQAPSGTFVVTAQKRPDGLAELRTFKVTQSTETPGAFFLSNALDTRAVVAGSAFELDHFGGGAPTRFVLAAQSQPQGRSARTFAVNSVTGKIDLLDYWTWGAASTQVSVTRVPGFSPRDVFALGFLNSNGNPAVEVLEMDAQGAISSLGKASSDEDTLPSSALRIAEYRDGGVMLAYQDGVLQRLEVWALDASATGSSITPEMVTRTELGQDGLHGFCRVPDDQAEGDFLLTRGAFFAEGLRVQAWRSAPRN